MHKKQAFAICKGLLFLLQKVILNSGKAAII